MSTRLRIEMLGGFQVHSGSHVIRHFRTRQTASLLAFLTLNRGKPISRELLAEMFWPDARDSERARSSLSVSLSSLRSQLEVSPSEPVFLAEARTLGLSAVGLSCDVFEFEEALQRIPAEDSPKAIAMLKEALALFRGAFLPGFYDDWVLGEQVRLKGLYLAGIRRLSHYFQCQGSIDEALLWRRQELFHFPEDSSILEALLRLLISEDRPQEATEAFYEVRRYWKKNGLGPLPAPLVQQVELLLELYPEPSSRKGRRPAASFLSPERPPIKPVAIAELSLGTLPLELTRFVGRQNELEQIIQFLYSPSERFLTLLGMGGVGKTRLALQAAQELKQRGVSTYFLSLQSVNSEQDFLLALASGLRIALPSGPEADPLGTLCQALAVPEPILLVFDNCEQLVGTPVIALIAQLLHRAPTLSCLATSQQRLGLPGERTHIVSPLPTPSALDLEQASTSLEEFESTWPSVALFIDRAQESVPHFRLNRVNQRHVVEIVHLLEGVPLAILLAAARVQVLPLVEIAAGIASGKKRFQVLSAPRKQEPERHQSLYSSLSWSYGLLRPSLQEFFKKLTVFQGSFRSHDAEVVLSEPLALDYIAELCDSSFLIAHITDTSVRFTMLESVCLFGQEQWTLATEKEAQRHCHASHYASLAEQAQVHWRTDQEGYWRDRLEVDWDNLKAALRWSEEHDDPEHLRLAFRFGSALSRFWWISVRHHEGEAFLTRLLRRPHLKEAITAQEYLRLQISLISQLFVSARRAEARLLCLSGIELARESQDRVSEAILCANLGSIELDVSGWEAGMHYLNQAIALFQEVGDHKRLITIYHNLCLNNLARRQAEEAKRFAAAELQLSLEQGSLQDQISAIQSCANYLLVEQTYEKAAQLYTELLRYHLLNNNLYDIINISKCISIALYLAQGTPHQLDRIQYLTTFSRVTGMREGVLSAKVLLWHQLVITPIPLPAPDHAKEQIRTWAHELAGTPLEPPPASHYEFLARDLMAFL